MLGLIEQASNTIGIIGVILVLIAYYLLNTDKINALDMRYLLLNLIGSVLILVSLMFHWNLSSVIIEIAWIAISLIGIYRAKYSN
jgi:hypothetical protein